MGQLAEAFVNFLAHVHDANRRVGAGETQKAEHAVSEAARSLMGLYVAYQPTDPEDALDASAVKLIEKVRDMETFASLVIPK